MIGHDIFRIPISFKGRNQNQTSNIAITELREDCVTYFAVQDWAALRASFSLEYHCLSVQHRQSPWPTASNDASS